MDWVRSIASRVVPTQGFIGMARANPMTSGAIAMGLIGTLYQRGAQTPKSVPDKFCETIEAFKTDRRKAWQIFVHHNDWLKGVKSKKAKRNEVRPYLQLLHVAASEVAYDLLRRHGAIEKSLKETRYDWALEGNIPDAHLFNQLTTLWREDGFGQVPMLLDDDEGNKREEFAAAFDLAASFVRGHWKEDQEPPVVQKPRRSLWPLALALVVAGSMRLTRSYPLPYVGVLR